MRLKSISHKILLFQCLKIKGQQALTNNLFINSRNFFSLNEILLLTQNSTKEISSMQKAERHDGHGHVD